MPRKGFDVFISHASEDKAHVARPLSKLLESAGLAVWLDEAELTLGDSLRRSIDLGLSASRRGVVILSPSFFAKEWPRRELDALFARMTFENSILPVWHRISHNEVLAKAPLLADRLAVSTSSGLQAVADAILKALAKRKDRGNKGKPSRLRTAAPRSPRQPFLQLDRLDGEIQLAVESRQLSLLPDKTALLLPRIRCPYDNTFPALKRLIASEKLSRTSLEIEATAVGFDFSYIGLGLTYILEWAIDGERVFPVVESGFYDQTPTGWLVRTVRSVDSRTYRHTSFPRRENLGTLEICALNPSRTGSKSTLVSIRASLRLPNQHPLSSSLQIQYPSPLWPVA